MRRAPPRPPASAAPPPAASPLAAPACWGECCKSQGCNIPGQCFSGTCALKEQLIQEFNALRVPGMDQVTDLNALPGSYINLEYTLPGGQKVKFWDDSRVYLGNQLCKHDGSGRCYGLTADEEHLLVCEYGDSGSDPEIVVYKRREK